MWLCIFIFDHFICEKTNKTHLTHLKTGAQKKTVFGPEKEKKEILWEIMASATV